MTNSSNQQHPQQAERAETASHSVHRLFGDKAFKIPQTLLGAVNFPDYRPLTEKLLHWHYWWQAHYIDATLDAGFRAYRTGDTAQAQKQLKRAHQLLRGIMLRNLGGFVNDFYDDMAWLTLASERINELSYLLTGKGSIAAQDAGRVLYEQLEDAIDNTHGGGAYWSKERNFKNTPANAPIALAFVRAHRLDEALDLLNWLHDTLWDASNNVYLDGLRIEGDKTSLEKGKYSYNNGPVLGALLELPEAAASSLNFDRKAHIAQLIEGVFAHFTSTFTDAKGLERTVLASGGDGDGGLFPGILARYLALAVKSPLVTEQDKIRLGQLLAETAEIYWAGRREFDPDLPMSTPGIDPNSIQGKAAALFSPDITQHVSDVLAPGAPAELSSQLTAWMVLEAAASLDSI